MTKTERSGLPRILMIAQMPPPASGMPVVNAQMEHALAHRTDLMTIDTLPDGLPGGIIYHVRRALRFATALGALIRSAVQGRRILYMPVDDGFAMAWDVLILAFARLWGMTIFLHHHSFRYIVARAGLMTLLTAVAGRHATHIHLCDCMAEEFAKLYPNAANVLIAPNCVDAPPVEVSHAPKPRADLTIGMLSNLTLEKGVGEFIKVLEAALAKGMNVRGILAGPASSQDAERLIAEALARLGNRLEWRGAVYGDAKEIFFRDIDLFLFPTRYRTESFGLVLLEALVRNRPIIAWERGCIGIFRQSSAATIVPLDQQFSAAALDKITQLAKHPEQLEQLQARAGKDGERINAVHGQAQDRLADTIARIDTR